MSRKKKFLTFSSLLGRYLKIELILRSTIYNDLLTRTLKRGAWIGGGGALLIILGGTLLPLVLLKIWGIPLFCTGMACISIGLLPYRRLTWLQLKPHTLYLSADQLTFFRSGKPLLKIALCSLEKSAYLENEKQYGIGLWLKRPIIEKVKVLQPDFNFVRFSEQSMENFEGCDFFLPYFSRHAWGNLRDLLEPDHAS